MFSNASEENLQKQPLLWIHQRRVFRGVTEERCVEHLDVRQDRRGFYIVWVGNQGWVDTGRNQFLVGKKSPT